MAYHEVQVTQVTFLVPRDLVLLDNASEDGVDLGLVAPVDELGHVGDEMYDGVLEGGVCWGVKISQQGDEGQAPSLIYFPLAS